MKNFIVKHAAGVIGIILIAAIVLITLTLTGSAPITPPISGGDLEDLSNVTPKPDGSNDGNPNGSNVNNPNGSNGDDTQQTTPPVITYIPTLPKASSPSDTYLYTQNLCGVGNVTLKNVHQTTVGLFTVVESDCAIGDIGGAKPTVGVAKSDALGNVEAVINLPTTVAAYFVASQITPLGLVVITANSNRNYLYVNIIDYDLGDVKTQLVSYADNAYVYPTADSFIILADFADDSLIYNYADEKFTFQSMPACNIIRIFEYTNYFTILYNSESGYALCELTKTNFAVKRELFVSSAKLIDIIPLMENGEQVFIALESDGALYAQKYDKSFAAVASARKKLGSFEIMGSGSDGKQIYLAVKGSMNGVINLNADLSSSFYSCDSAFLAATIHDYAFINNQFIFLASDKSGKLALTTVNQGTSAVRYFENTVGKAYFAVHPNGTYTIIYDGKFYDYNAVQLLGINI